MTSTAEFGVVTTKVPARPTGCVVPIPIPLADRHRFGSRLNSGRTRSDDRRGGSRPARQHTGRPLWPAVTGAEGRQL